MGEPGVAAGGSAAGWRPLASVTRWLRAALAGFVGVGALSVGALLWLGLLARDASPTDDPDGLGGARTTVQVLWGAQVMVMLVILVLVITWTRRLAANHVALARPGTRFGTPGWAVGSWLVWFVLPVLVVRELWKGSDPQVPEGSPAWKRVPTTPVVPIWFVTFVVGTLATNLTNDALGNHAPLDPGRLADLTLWRCAATALLVLSAGLLHHLAGALTGRQEAAIAAT